LIILFGLYIYNKIFNIDLSNKRIYIFGAKNVSQSEIKKFLIFNIYNTNKINLINTKNYILRAKPELKNIKIYRYYDRIIIKVSERVPELYTNKNGKIFGIDNKNMMFPIHKVQLIGNIPKINYKSLNEKNKLLRFIRIVKVLSNSFYDNVAEVSFNSLDEIIIQMRNDVIIVWGIYEMNKAIILSKLQKLQTVYKDMTLRYSKIKYIDMSYYNYGKIIAKQVES
jgi:hypothetical protein